jgi:hypothetical protein
MNKRAGCTLALLLVFLSGASAFADSGAAVGWSVIANGGAPSSGGTVMLNDTFGQSIAGPATSGSAGLNAGYWAACAAAAAVAPTVSAEKGGLDVALSWTVNATNAQHQVWVSENPYLDPANPGNVTPSITTSTSYTDQSAATSLTSHYYAVRGLNGCGAASGDSNRTGAFAFELTKETS